MDVQFDTVRAERVKAIDAELHALDVAVRRRKVDGLTALATRISLHNELIELGETH